MAADPSARTWLADRCGARPRDEAGAPFTEGPGASGGIRPASAGNSSVGTVRPPGQGFPVPRQRDRGGGGHGERRLAAVGDLVVWSKRDQDIYEPQGPLLNVIFAVMLLSSAVGTVLALFIAVRGLVRRRRGDLRLAAVVFALCLTFWLSLWIADLIRSTS
jgi:hypothetical protein